jgi:hypothetical protein
MGQLAEARTTLETAMARFPPNALPPATRGIMASLKAGRKPRL